MFYKLGITQLLKNKRVMALSVLAISLGVGIFYANNISNDTIQSAIARQENFLFGNIDYMIYRTGMQYHDNMTYGIPYSYMGTIRAISGVKGVVARADAPASFYAPDDVMTYTYEVISIDTHNKDETSIGISNVTSYLPAIGTGTKTLEQVLNYTGVARPVVISKRLSISIGINPGDTIRIIPANATKLYATPSELSVAGNDKTKLAALEQAIRNNATRMNNSTFNVVAIVIDGSEGPSAPVPSDSRTISGITPSDDALYARLNDSLQWIFNQNAGEVGFFMVDTSSYSGGARSFDGSVATAMGMASIVGNDVRQSIQSYIDYVSLMIFVILGMLLVSAWVSCYVLIKTVMQMRINEKLRELGIIRAMGFKKRAISEVIMSQVLVMAGLGICIGLGIGLIPPQFFDMKEISTFLSYNKQYAMGSIQVTVSLLSTGLAVASGLILPIISGYVPIQIAKRWSIVEMISPTYMQMRETSDAYQSLPPSIKSKAWNRLVKAYGLFEAIWLWKNVPHVPAGLVAREIASWKEKHPNRLKKRHRSRNAMNPKLAAFWVIVLVASFLAFFFGSTKIFAEPGSFKIDLDRVWGWLLAMGSGMFFLLVSIWQLSADQIGGVSSIFARLQCQRLGPISHYIPRSVHANTRNMKNLIGFLTMGIALVVGLTILDDTIMRGNVAMNHSYLGSDIVVYNPMIPRTSLADIRGIDGVISATTYTGVVMDNWHSNSDPSYAYIVNTVDGYGGMHDNALQNLNVIIIQPDEYLTLNPQTSIIHNEFSTTVSSIYDIDSNNPFEDVSAFVHRLDQPMTTIVGTPLLATLHKNVGDSVTVSINGFVATLQIIGSASNMPAVPYLLIADSTDGTYNTRSMVISRSTFASMLDDFIGGVDIMIKNMTLPTSLLNHNYSSSTAGYTSGMINMTTVPSNISSIPGIDSVAYRFSTFAPGAPSLNVTYNPSQMLWLNSKVNLTKELGAEYGTTGPKNQFPLPLRMYVVDGREDLFMAGSQNNVAESSAFADLPFSPPGDSTVENLLDWHVSKVINNTASQVLYLIDKEIEPNKGAETRRTTFFNSNSICVTSQYVTAYTSPSNETYVYKLKPMDNITFSVNTTSGFKVFNFTVAATLDNHLAYWLQNGSIRDGYKLSSESLNYNFKANSSSDLASTFDVDGNVFLTTRHEMEYMASELSGFPPGLGVASASDLVNYVDVKIQSGYDASQVADALRTKLNAFPHGNYSVITYKQRFIDSFANSGALAVNIDPSIGEDAVMARLEAWFTSHGYAWNIAHVGSMSRQNINSDIGIVQPIFQIFFVISIFSLIISAVGLCTILYANAMKRHREFGIYKALGYSKKKLREMVFFETFLVTGIGIIAGTIAGIAMMAVMYQAIKPSIILPLLLNIPAWSICVIVAMLLVIAALTSRLIALHFKKLTTIETIKYNE